jgi:hypothetical protein
MLVTFKSKAAADVVMYEQHAKRILDLLHKDVQRGVITADELDATLESLESVLGESRNQAPAEALHRDGSTHPGEAEADGEHAHSEYVSFAVRAYPLLEMLREAKKRHVNVVWGI